MTSLSDEVDMLRRIPLFAQIEPSKLKLLAFTSERLNFQEKQDIFRQGDEGDAAYVIMEGSADVVINTPAGEHVVASLSGMILSVRSPSFAMFPEPRRSGPRRTSRPSKSTKRTFSAS